MPPDSKDLSSLKDKSPSFHRLHATDLDRMKGIYLSAEELRGFDKYKVRSIDWIADSIDHRSSRRVVTVFFKSSLKSLAFSGLFYFPLVQIGRYITIVKLLNTSFLEFCCGGEDNFGKNVKIVAATIVRLLTPLSKLTFRLIACKTFCTLVSSFTETAYME